GVPEFISYCKKNKSQGAIGLDLKIKIINTEWLISLFAVNEEGYESLISLSNIAMTGLVTIDDLKGKEQSLIIVIPALCNENVHIFDDTRLLNNLTKNFFLSFIGIDHYDNEDLAYINEIRELANKYTYDCVAFPNIKYIKEDDAIILEIVNAINNDSTLSIKEKKGKYFFPTKKLLENNYLSTELENTIKIVEACNFTFDNKRGQMMKYCPNDFEELKTKSIEALKEYGLTNDKYQNRLNYELDIINKMGYPSYFLVVADYVKFAKENGIFVGPGRGSAAGSLVSYLLGITKVDPLKHDLLFERFLNSNRVTMPDIDIDFEDIRREDVVNYLKKKYGNERVSNIITFQTIGAKQSLRDIGRVYKYPTRDIDLLSKSISDNKIDLHNAYRKIPAFKQLVDSDKYYLEIVSLASKIEGLPRQSSIHAAGIILNDEPIEKKLPIIKDTNNNLISQYEMNFLESQGFLKMDLLGLRNLTIIHKCLELIRNNKKININYDTMNFDIPEIYQMISSGKTMGLFQLESSGIRRAINILKPQSFDDVVALLALFRPGPMDNIETYAKRKQGQEKITYLVPQLEPILKTTYGIIIYQEQIMQIVTTIAGFTLAEADIFRRAISKKESSKMIELEQQFLDGATNNGYSKNIAKQIFDNILKFANYGFNKSHSVAYAFITCQMAWLKYNYPIEFYISLLEVGSSNSDVKFNEYISEIKANNLQIHLPNINISNLEYEQYQDGLIIPLTAIRGITNELANNIIMERNKNGAYKDLFDFTLRMKNFGITNAQIFRLIDAGALSPFELNRATLRANVENALIFASINSTESNQLSLLKVNDLPKPALTYMNDDPLDNFNLEFEALGITISKTILSYKKDYLKNNNIKTINEALSMKGTSTFAGIIKNKKIIKTKTGKPMAFVKVFDEDDEVELTVFPDDYAKCLMNIEVNNAVIINGKYDNQDTFIATNIQLLKEED
ncbi:MAG: DNA polymerase III subunit alpha, partial [Bacilli bacterium]|nr:DNA polymerase III subunit alpha [Bacilli bacterium]